MTAKHRIHEIADALALHMGGTHVPANNDGEFFDWYACVTVDMPAPSHSYKIGLTRKGYGADAGKITATLAPAPYSGELLQARIPWPSARIDEKRDLQAIVADIARRVCNAPEAATALNAHAAALKERNARAAGVNGAMDDILASCKAHESPNFPRSSSEGRIFSTSGSGYFNARVSPTSVYFDRLGSVSIDQAKRIIAILEEPTE